MREVLADLLRWWDAGETVGLATVVGTWKSAPRPPGAAMLVGPDGTATGSVSGGCVEGALYELAGRVRSGDPATLVRYGVGDDDAFAVGLTCGGTIEVFVQAVDRRTFPDLDVLADAVRHDRPVALATVIAGRDDQIGRHLVIGPGSDLAAGGPGLGDARIDQAVTDDARGMLAAGRTGVLTYGPSGERRGEGLQVFVAAFTPPARMLVFGAIDFGAAVAHVGAFLGYRVTVCDARPVFATARRFPTADEVVVDWPHRYLAEQHRQGRIDERTVICVLTHDPKFDVPVLELALRLPVAYVGAMGSRQTHDDRRDRLVRAGLTETELARLSSPIGLDLGARTPEETAISIAAEIVAARWRGSGRPLTDVAGAIHHDQLPANTPLEVTR